MAKKKRGGFHKFVMGFPGTVLRETIKTVDCGLDAGIHMATGDNVRRRRK